MKNISIRFRPWVSSLHESSFCVNWIWSFSIVFCLDDISFLYCKRLVRKRWKFPHMNYCRGTVGLGVLQKSCTEKNIMIKTCSGLLLFGNLHAHQVLSPSGSEREGVHSDSWRFSLQIVYWYILVNWYILVYIGTLVYIGLLLNIGIL